RRYFHEAIAKILIDAYPDLALTQPELIAQHYVKAQLDELAFPYWMKAGNRALGRSANYEAVDHFQNALTIAEHLPDGPDRQRDLLHATLKLSEALCAAGRLLDSVAKYKLAAHMARQATDARGFIDAAIGLDGAQALLSQPDSISLLREAMAML